MTSRQLVDFVEAKLKQHGIGKVIPTSDALAKTYQMFVASDRLCEAFEEARDAIEYQLESVTVPDDLEAQVQTKLRECPHIPWHRAVRLIIDPDATESDDDDNVDLADEDDDDLDEEGD
jgi:hypothetical protein